MKPFTNRPRRLLQALRHTRRGYARHHFGRATPDGRRLPARFRAAWRHDFEPKDASILNRMVRYAVFDRCFGFGNGEGNFMTPRIFDQLTGLINRRKQNL